MSQLERREEGHVTVLAWDQPSGERREVEVSGRRLKIVDHGRGRVTEHAVVPWVLVQRVGVEQGDGVATVSLHTDDGVVHVAIAIEIELAEALRDGLESLRERSSGRSPMSARRVLQHISHQGGAEPDHSRDWHPDVRQRHQITEQYGSVVVRAHIDHAEVIVARADHARTVGLTWMGIAVGAFSGFALLLIAVIVLASRVATSAVVGAVSLMLACALLCTTGAGLLLAVLRRQSPTTTLELSQHGVRTGGRLVPWSALKLCYLKELGHGNCAIHADTPEGRVPLVARMLLADAPWLVTRIEMARPIAVESFDDTEPDGVLDEAGKALLDLRDKVADR